jgi:hypothetical protein
MRSVRIKLNSAFIYISILIVIQNILFYNNNTLHGPLLHKLTFHYGFLALSIK